VQGQIDAGTSNRISDEWPIEQAMSAGDAVRSLLDHPGWGIVMDLVERARSDGMEILINAGPLEQAAYARRLGGLSGMRFAADVAATVIACAEGALQHAKDIAALEASVEGS
jgi:hypothetical protein